MDSILKYVKVYDWLHTSGQPTEEELDSLRVKNVINLALPSADNAVEREAMILGNAGVNYLNIPVNFENPTHDQFQLFCSFLNTVKGGSVLVHCAYNMRVSAFIFLYKVKVLGVSKDEAEIELNKLWRPNEVWEAFMQGELKTA